MENIASASSEPPAYRRGKEETRCKRKAEEQMERSLNNRKMEEEDNRKRQDKASKGSLKKAGGETAGTIDKTVNLDLLEEEEFQEKKKDLKEKKIPLVISQGVNWKRAAWIGQFRSIGGKHFIFI